MAHFETTHWSVIRAAAGEVTGPARAALEELCRTYWPPVYAYVRRWEPNAEMARDLTQEFFARLLEKKTVAAADRERGRFRTFLLAALRNFLADAHARAKAQKRGGDRVGFSLDFAGVDSRLRHEPSHALTPDRLFEREWALRLLEVVLGRLRAEYESAGNGERFELLKPAIGPGGGPAIREAASRLGLSENAVRVAVHRLRKRYRALLREEIAQTVADSAEVDDEIGRLFAALG